MTDRLGIPDPSVFTPSRWRSIEPILDAALELSKQDRAAYVSAACGGDASLLADVEQLLAAHNASTADFDAPAAARFASLLDAERPRLPDVLGGRYRIGPMLGRGGMATVYLADDLRHERQVAVKVLHADLAAALGAELFLAEIKTTAQLHHPHILPLHDSGDADGLLYYVMPYVPGGTLRHRLRDDQPLSIDEVLRIATEVAGALDAAHRQGVVHRDIKPENILLHDGTALVADFGIALAVRAAAVSRTTGVILGTRQYMSPEQATKDASVNGRSDVYSLAIVVYEMLAGRLPFEVAPGERNASSVASIHESRDEVCAAVDGVVARALAVAPEDRYATAGEFIAALRHGLTAPIQSVDTARKRRRRAVGLGVAVAVVLVAAGAALVQSRRTNLPQPRGSTNQEALDLVHQGTAWIDKRNLAGNTRAESLFKRAIAADSTYADAHAWLAQSYVIYAVGNVGDFDAGRYLRLARSEAERALGLDSASAQAYAAAANVSMFYDLDWARADYEVARALALEPQSVEARAAKVTLLYFTGRISDAIKEARENVWLQARTEQPKIELARALFFDRQDDAAMEQLSWVAERDSSRLRVHILLGELLAHQGKYDSAVVEMQAEVRHANVSSRSHAFLAWAYERAGRHAEATRELDGIRAKARQTVVPALNLAIAHLGLGDVDSTFVWLNKAIDDHSMRPYVLGPTFDAIRTDPRYPALMSRMHLPYRPGVLPQRGRSEPRPTRSVNPRAFDYFLDGTIWLNQLGGRERAMTRAESSFKLAIALDSNFADPHAGLSHVYVTFSLGNFGDFEPEKYLLAARRETRRALELDSMVAEAHASEANVLMFYDMDWTGAEHEAARALELDSTSVTAYAAKIALAEYLGRFGDAIVAAREYARLQPRIERAKLEVGRALFFDRQFTAAAEQLRRTVDRDSTAFRARLLLGEVLAAQAKYDSALSEMQASLRHSNASSRPRAYLAHIYARMGRAAEAQKELNTMYEKQRTAYVPALDFAIAYAGFGNKDSTFAWLDRSIVEHSMRPYLFDPTFDFIRSDLRYSKLLAKMHLPNRTEARRGAVR